MNGFKEVLFITIVYLLVLGGISFFYGYVNKKLTNRIFENYRQEVYSGIMRMSFSDFEKSNSAEYISALSNDMNIVKNIIYIYDKEGVDKSSTYRKFRQLRSEGNRKIARSILYYNLFIY